MAGITISTQPSDDYTGPEHPEHKDDLEVIQKLAMPYMRACHLPRSVKYFRSPLAVDDSRVSKQIIKQLDFKSIKRIALRFNPLLEKTESIRRFCIILSEPKWRTSNSNLLVKTSVLSENNPPEVEITYDNGQVLLVKTENLSLRDVMEVIILHTNLITTQ
ncbi:hypothetical protein MN116_008502 [Schistosoma mekongi]|uniref:Large ribosomal subunit protein mL53 n=1 Tax=Schistosoma mekongi TaxID=38744 RepID=A0AAE2D1P5_SCHME|nr:hypothetical protein MN116_008502 [Schistosoma mekongi]